MDLKLEPQRLKLTSGLFNLVRNLGGAIGIAVCGTLLNDRANERTGPEFHRVVVGTGPSGTL